MIIPNNCPICDLPINTFYGKNYFNAKCKCDYYYVRFNEHTFEFYESFYTPIYYIDNIKKANYFCSRIYRRTKGGPVWLSEEYLLLESNQYISYSNFDRFLNMKVFI